MNERILEAAFQALLINKAVIDDSYFIDDPKLMVKLNKFAELIVQECANVLHDNELWNREISHVLNKHFGVEE